MALPLPVDPVVPALVAPEVRAPALEVLGAVLPVVPPPVLLVLGAELPVFPPPLELVFEVPEFVLCEWAPALPVAKLLPLWLVPSREGWFWFG